MGDVWLDSAAFQPDIPHRFRFAIPGRAAGDSLNPVIQILSTVEGIQMAGRDGKRNEFNKFFVAQRFNRFAIECLTGPVEARDPLAVGGSSRHWQAVLMQ